MYEHLTPSHKIISYSKLCTFVDHQIKVFKQEIEGIENNALYYVLQDPDTLKELSNLQSGLEQWEWFKEIIQEQLEILEI